MAVTQRCQIEAMPTKGAIIESWAAVNASLTDQSAEAGSGSMAVAGPGSSHRLETYVVIYRIVIGYRYLLTNVAINMYTKIWGVAPLFWAERSDKPCDLGDRSSETTSTSCRAAEAKSL